jgi:hypothetical protein
MFKQGLEAVSKLQMMKNNGESYWIRLRQGSKKMIELGEYPQIPPKKQIN